VVRAFVLALLLLCSPAATTPCAGEEYRNPAAGILRMSYEEGRVTLETRDAPLSKVLEEFGRLADVAVVSDGPLEDRVTVYVSGLPPDAAARKILRGKDLSFIYRASKAAGQPDEYPLSEIRIYDAQETTGRAQPFSYGTAPADRREATRARRETRPAARTPAQARRLESTLPRDDDSMAAADSFLSGLLGGNLHMLDEVAERLKQDHPEAREQIEQFLQVLEEAKTRAAESGGGMPSLEDLGGMGAIMHRMMQQQHGEEY